MLTRVQKSNHFNLDWEEGLWIFPKQYLLTLTIYFLRNKVNKIFVKLNYCRKSLQDPHKQGQSLYEITFHTVYTVIKELSNSDWILLIYNINKWCSNKTLKNKACKNLLNTVVTKGFKHLKEQHSCGFHLGVLWKGVLGQEFYLTSWSVMHWTLFLPIPTGACSSV